MQKDSQALLLVSAFEEVIPVMYAAAAPVAA